MITTRSRDRAELSIEVVRRTATQIGRRITGGTVDIGYNTPNGYLIEVHSHNVEFDTRALGKIIASIVGVVPVIWAGAEAFSARYECDNAPSNSEEAIERTIASQVQAVNIRRELKSHLERKEEPALSNIELDALRVVSQKLQEEYYEKYRVIFRALVEKGLLKEETAIPRRYKFTAAGYSLYMAHVHSDSIP